MTKIQFKIGETKERIYWPVNWEGKFLMAKEIFIFILPSSLCLFLPLCLPSFILLQSLFPSVKNICVFLKFKCGNPNAQFDSIWRWLGLDEVMRVPPRHHGICVYIARGRQSRSLSLSTTWGHSKRVPICNPRRDTSPDTKPTSILTLDFPDSRPMRNKIPLLKATSPMLFSYSSIS